jgi:hypothetical protein
MVAVFAALRIVAVLHSPVQFSDTRTYLALNFLGADERLWTVPLIWNALPANDLRIAVQIVLGIVAWSALAVSLHDAVEGMWLKRIATAVVLLIGLVPQVTGWDSTLLSESLSTSLLVLLIALLLRLDRRYSPPLATGVFGVAMLWVFTRQTSALIFVLLTPLVLVFVLRVVDGRRRWVTVGVIASLALWGGFAATRNTPAAAGLWKWNALQILENRVAVDPTALNFFHDHGLPESNEVLAERGAFLAGASPLWQERPVMNWVDHDYRSTYASYLLSTWRHTLSEPFAQLPTAVSSVVTGGLPARTVLPEPITQLFWGTTEGDIPFWLAVAAGLALAASARRARIKHLRVSLLLLAAAALGAIMTWNLTGYGPTAGESELARLFMPVAITLRIGLLLVIVTCVEALGRSGLRSRSAAVPVP